MEPSAGVRSEWADSAITTGSNIGGSPPPKKPRHQRPPTSEAGQDLISNLPDGCTTHIFSFLPSQRDRCSCAAVSRKWLLLQALMRPFDFLLLSDTPDPVGSLLEDVDVDNGPQKGALKDTRCLDALSASDARLAAMAVGASSAHGTPFTKLIISADSFLPPPRSSLLHVTAMGLSFISQAYPQLTRITLLGCKMVGNEGLAAIAGGCPGLEGLYISRAPMLGDAGLIPVARSCPKLTDLTLDMCPLVGDGALQAFAQCSSILESLSLHDCPLMSDAGLVPVLSSPPRLARVTIAFMKVGDAALEAVAARGGENPLRFLSLESVSHFTPLGFRRLVLAANLRSLSVRRCDGLDEAFSRGGGNDGALAEASFVQLRRVAVRNCEAFADAGLVLLSESTRQLESLRLEKCHGVTTMGLSAAVENWSGTLRLLSLVRCDGVGTLPQQEQEQGSLFRNRCPHLQTLAIKRCPQVDDAFLSLLGRSLVKARHVEVVGMGSVTDRGFVSLLTSMELRNALRTVDLSGCKRITDWSVVALVGASGGVLGRLTLRGCKKVTDQSLRVIGQLCPALEEMDLTGCKRVGDAGVAALLGGPGKSRLEMLSLEGCEGVTDGSLRSLAEMAAQGSLEWANLRRCDGLTRASVDAARQALWWCDIVH